MSKKKFFVLDTNIVLHDPKFHESFDENDLHIPIQLLEEVDKYKNGFEPINYNAREFIRFMDNLPEEKLFSSGASLGEGLGKIRMIMDNEINEVVLKHFPDKNKIDNQILNSAYCLQASNPKTEVVLISKDVNLRMKAKSLKIKAEDYKNDMISSVDLLYKKTRSLSVEENVIDTLFKKEIVAYQDLSLIENEFFILNSNSSKKTCLGVYKKGDIHLVSKEKLGAFGIKPKNSEQAFAMYALLDPDISLVSIMGKAGSGKTILSLAAGLQQMDEGNFEELLFTRQIIAMGNNDIGFLPGDAKEKVSPYMKGIFDNLSLISDLQSKNKTKIDQFKRDEKISIEPLFSIRGRSMPRVYFIIDEAQNLTPNEVKTIITRAGEGAKIILIGDITQIDSPKNSERSNGLSHVIEKFNGQEIYAHIILQKGERSFLSELASNIL